MSITSPVCYCIDRKSYLCPVNCAWFETFLSTVSVPKPLNSEKNKCILIFKAKSSLSVLWIRFRTLGKTPDTPANRQRKNLPEECRWWLLDINTDTEQHKWLMIVWHWRKIGRGAHTFWLCCCWGSRLPCLRWNLPSWPGMWSTPTGTRHQS